LLLKQYSYFHPFSLANLVSLIDSTAKANAEVILDRGVHRRWWFSFWEHWVALSIVHFWKPSTLQAQKSIHPHFLQKVLKFSCRAVLVHAVKQWANFIFVWKRHFPSPCTAVIPFLADLQWHLCDVPVPQVHSCLLLSSFLCSINLPAWKYW
jgi:hypothetical protein